MQNRDPAVSPVDIDQLIGARIRHRRILLGMTQDQLGAKIGISYQQIQKYETGANRVSASRLYQMADILDIDIAWFYRQPALQDTDEKIEASISSRHVIELVRNFSLIEHEKLQLTVLSLVKTLASREKEIADDTQGNEEMHFDTPQPPALPS